MTTHDDFEHTLRQGLATLAREAVPDVPVAPSALPPVRMMPRKRERRLGPRLLAAGVTIAVATASVVVALSVRSGSHTPPIKPSSVWTKVAPSPLRPRSSQAAVFTGRDVIIWGGRSDAAGGVAATVPAGEGVSSYELADGAAYDPATDRWRVLPSAPISGRSDAVAAWTGSEMLIVGGRFGGGSALDGAAYDPSTGRWRPIPNAPTCPTFGAWDGTRLIVGGTCTNEVTFAAYDPARNQWTSLPAFAPATHLVAAGGRLYAWESGDAGRGAVFDSSTRRWSALPAVTGRENPLQDSVAIAYRNRLAVVGRVRGHREAGPDLAFAAILGPQGWTTIASQVAPPLGNTVVASADGAVVWSSAMSLGAVTIDQAMRSYSLVNVGDAPIAIDRSGQSIVAIGYRRFLVWGGRLAGTAQDPTNRPTADGAIVQVRSLEP